MYSAFHDRSSMIHGLSARYLGFEWCRVGFAVVHGALGWFIDGSWFRSPVRSFMRLHVDFTDGFRSFSTVHGALGSFLSSGGALAVLGPTIGPTTALGSRCGDEIQL